MNPKVTLHPGKQSRWAWPVVGAVTLGLLLPWWRNHALLRDFYDYGLVMAGAGRVNLGERPYVDFVTPIQSLLFWLAAVSEKIFGARYLSLTYANAFFIAGSFAAFVALLRKPLGPVVAGAVAAAVVAASSGQHTIVWHNALGVLWLALAIWGLARWSEETNGRACGLALVVVALALWMGGMTKLTYQVTALAFVGLGLVRAAWLGRTSWLGAAGLGVALIFIGTVVPVATELAWTGASFQAWLDNVVFLAQSRSEHVKGLATWAFYWHTPHNYHQPMYLPFVGAWGVVVIVAAAWAAGRGSDVRARVMAIVAAAGAVVCAGVLLATNQEIAYLAGAASLAMATGVIVLGKRDEAGRVNRFGRVVLGVAAVSLLVPAWLSAWQGARALWGAGPLVRSELVAADRLPARFGYLRGMKIERGRIESLEGFDQFVDFYAKRNFGQECYYFVNGTEWLVRAVPGARHRGLPLWLHLGTTFSSKTVKPILDAVDAGPQIQFVVSDRPWDVWFAGMGEVMAKNYRRAEVGPLLLAYITKEERLELLGDPLEFLSKTDTNLFSRFITTSGSRLTLRADQNGKRWLSQGSHELTLDFELYDLKGEMVLELPSWTKSPGANAMFQVWSTSGGPEHLMWEEKMQVTSQQRVAVRAFSVSPGGRKVRLKAIVSPGVAAYVGWRKLHTTHAGELGAEALQPFDFSLPAVAPLDNWWHSLFAPGHRPPVELHAFGPDIRAADQAGVPELFAQSPHEIWIKITAPSTKLTGEFGLRDTAWQQADATPGVSVQVIYYKSGRLQVLHQRDLRPKTDAADRGAHAFEIFLPEPVGWVVLKIKPLETNNNNWAHAFWRKLRIQ